MGFAPAAAADVLCLVYHLSASQTAASTANNVRTIATILRYFALSCLYLVILHTSLSKSAIVICIISCTGIKVVAKDDQNVHKLHFLYTIKRYFYFFVKNAGKFHFFDCQILTSVEIKGILCIQKAFASLFPGDVLHMKEVSL